MKQIRRHVTYANVMSSLAVFMVLGGATAFAATKIGANELKANSVKTGKIVKEAVVTGKIKNNAVTESKIANGAVTTNKIASDAVTGEKVKESTLAAVPNADKLAGKDPSAYESKAFNASTNGNVSISGTGTTTVSSLDLPAGTFAIFGRGTVNNNAVTPSPNDVNCDLTAGASTVEVRNFFLGAGGDPGESEDFSASIVATLDAPGAAILTCTTNVAFNGNVITPEITAVSVQP